MADSDTVERQVSHEAPKLLRPLNHLSFASCVDSIKEGIRKLSGCKDENRKPPARKIAVAAGAEGHPLQEHRQMRATVQGGQILGVKRRRGASHAGPDKRKSSFEMYLSSIPTLDPIDRTVGWVFMQPDDNMEEERRDSYCNLPPRGTIIPHPQLTDSHVDLNNGGYETSLSWCESARGTHGRGTPPMREEGLPRLDDLFRQLQLRQEQEVRRRLMRGGDSHNLVDVYSSQVPGYPAGITPDLLPFVSHGPKRVPAALIHKNSSYYNHGLMPNGTKLPQPSSFDYVCEWNTCRTRFLTARELLTHVEEEHIGRLPVRMSGLRRSIHALTCHWRNCPDACKVFPARYKLLVHVQQCHCREKLQKSNVRPHSPDVDSSPPPTRPPRNRPPESTTNRKPPTRIRRQSVDRSGGPAISRKNGVHQGVGVIPELLVEAQPVVAKKRTRTYTSCEQRSPPER